MTTLAIPTVHLNGTSKRNLIEDLMKAREALNNAVNTLQEIGPNGRDYYVQNPSSFALAQEQHGQRVKTIVAIYDELGEIAQAIDAQNR